MSNARPAETRVPGVGRVRRRLREGVRWRWRLRRAGQGAWRATRVPAARRGSGVAAAGLWATHSSSARTVSSTSSGRRVAANHRSAGTSMLGLAIVRACTRRCSAGRVRVRRTGRREGGRRAREFEHGVGVVVGADGVERLPAGRNASSADAVVTYHRQAHWRPRRAPSPARCVGWEPVAQCFGTLARDVDVGIHDFLPHCGGEHRSPATGGRGLGRPSAASAHSPTPADGRRTPGRSTRR